MLTVMAKLMFLYEMHVQPGSALGEGSMKVGKDRSKENEFQTWDRFVSHPEELMVQFRQCWAAFEV
jgi:hypothetical protein